MAIIKDVTVKINNGTATLDAPVQFYEKDHDVELRFKLLDYKYKYDKDPQNILNSVDEDVLEAYTTIVNPRGYELEQINGVVKNDVVIFRLDPTYTDELDELGTYKLQIHIKCTHSEFTIPPITFEVLQRLKGIKVVTDGEDEVDNSEILDNSSKFVSDETGKLIIEWKKGDMISSAKLNAMVDVINDAVDEEVIRQANEKERERKAANKIQELENTRVEYVNKFDTELDSFADQVDESMTDYETRFNALTVSQQQDAEVIDARDGEQTLRARLERDIQKPSNIYEEVEGSYINADTTSGYAQNVEILGNTIQNQNDLADIRSVGDKVENQELYEIPVLSTGKNLWDKGDIEVINTSWNSTRFYYDFKDNVQYTISGKHKCDVSGSNPRISLYYKDGTSEEANSASITETNFTVTSNISKQISHINIYYSTATKECVYYVKDIQLEEGTQATEYEPYQERQITILSPVQLEKVEDVADRIICKDGVWGVEKNIKDIVLDGSANVTIRNDVSANDELCVFNINSVEIISNDCMSNLFISVKYDTLKDAESIRLSYFYKIAVIGIYKNRLTDSTVQGFKDFLNGNNLIIKVKQQPTFIPLPHDQQIKLRTFANKTNISFGCEIEPTLKASVPKSIGATVNTHTSQIDNLNKELDRVKKLEESTVSTVTSDKAFTTVAETSAGYFEDVKLEGKTLVNLASNQNNWRVGTDSTDGIDYTTINLNTSEIKINKINEINGYIFLFKKMDTTIFKPNTVYTLFANINDIDTVGIMATNINEIVMPTTEVSSGLNVIKFTSTDLSKITGNRDIGIYCRVNSKKISTNIFISNAIILEGDHTQNPPSYFEGLKSVGDGVDEISVLSCNENLLNEFEFINIRNASIEDGKVVLDSTSLGIARAGIGHKVYLEQGCNYIYSVANINDLSLFNTTVIVTPLDDVNGLLAHLYPDKVYTHTIASGYYYLRTTTANTKNGKLSFNISFNKCDTPKPYQPHKQDKKRILYYNDETQTWEKPILRQWDSIEKHSDGKYYYHKRSGEVVLNGSEPSWVLHNGDGNRTTVGMEIEIPPKYSEQDSTVIDIICDKLLCISASDSYGTNLIGVASRLNLIRLRLDPTKVGGSDLTSMKAWLQANPITVVYQLAEEKVYECTNLDLITYADETNLLVKSGVLNPKVSLKVSKGVGNTVTMLQNKVTMLEQMLFNLMPMFNNQQSNIDE